MKLIRRVAVISLLITLSACISLPKLSLPPERISQNGYSLLPLNEPGWLVLGRDKYSLGFVKHGSNEDESFVIQTMFSGVPEYKTNEEFLRVIKEGQAKDTSVSRFDIFKHEVISYSMRGVDCARSHLVSLDQSATLRSKRTGEMVLEALALICAHPSEKSLAINIVYSHRHYPGQEDPGFIEKGNAVLNSVKLFEPEQPYISQANKDNMAMAKKFSESCSKTIAKHATTSRELAKDKGDSSADSLSSMGIAIERASNGDEPGSYALFQKGEDGVFTLTSVQSSRIEPVDTDKQEILFISVGLDWVAPTFTLKNFVAQKNGFACHKGMENKSKKTSYNACGSTLTSTEAFKEPLLTKTLMTVMTLGTNQLEKLTTSYVDTDKDKVAKLVVDSNLLLCLNEGKRTKLNK